MHVVAYARLGSGSREQRNKEEKEEVGGSREKRHNNSRVREPGRRHGVARGSGRGPDGAHPAPYGAHARAQTRFSFEARSSEVGRQKAPSLEVPAEKGRRALSDAHRKAWAAPISAARSNLSLEETQRRKEYAFRDTRRRAVDGA